MISQTVLVAFEDFDGLDAARAAAAVGRGLNAGSGSARSGSAGTGSAGTGSAGTGSAGTGSAGTGSAGTAGSAASDAGVRTLHADLCPLKIPGGPAAHDPAAFTAQLAALDFDVRMRAARAVVVGAARLDEATLLGSATFEIATRARQGGVPAYGITAANALSRFDARILDLQVVLEARDARALRRAGQRLAGIV